jgi:two-component system alkaline phosphatase synthesis response regulator PhoP
MAANASDSYAFGPVHVDFRSAEVRRDGSPVDLSTLEIKLLRYFVEHRGAVLARDELLDKVWGYDATPVTRTVDVHVASLRQKLEANPSKPEYIVTYTGWATSFWGKRLECQVRGTERRGPWTSFSTSAGLNGLSAELTSRSRS